MAIGACMYIIALTCTHWPCVDHMQVKISPLRQVLVVGPNEMKTLQKVNWHIHSHTKMRTYTDTHTIMHWLILYIYPCCPDFLVFHYTGCSAGEVLPSGHRTPSTSPGLPHSKLNARMDPECTNGVTWVTPFTSPPCAILLPHCLSLFLFPCRSMLRNALLWNKSWRRHFSDLSNMIVANAYHGTPTQVTAVYILTCVCMTIAQQSSFNVQTCKSL